MTYTNDNLPERSIWIDLERMNVEEGSKAIIEIAVGLGFTPTPTLYNGDDYDEFLDERVTEAIAWLNDNKPEADDDCMWAIEDGSFGYWAIERCLSCEEVVDTENGDCRWSELKSGWLCSGCEQHDMETASRVVFFDAEGDKETVLVSTYFVVEREYFEEFTRVKCTRVWKSTDAWRGYFETTLDGYEEIKDLTGWTTGMPDDTVARKFDLNEWLQKIYEEDIECPVDFAVVTEVTSNVFSMSVAVWVKSGCKDQFVEWLNGDYEMLERGLR